MSALDRAWVRRPLVSPPPWGRSVPDVWAPVDLTFVRREARPSSLGGFGGSGERTYGPVAANIAIEAPSWADMVANVGGNGPIANRRYVAVVDAANLAAIPFAPAKGDHVRWTDAQGRAHDLPVTAADLPDWAPDHWEIQMDEAT